MYTYTNITFTSQLQATCTCTMWPAVQLLFFTIFLNVSAASGQEQSDAGELSGTGRTRYSNAASHELQTISCGTMHRLSKPICSVFSSQTIECLQELRLQGVASCMYGRCVPLRMWWQLWCMLHIVALQPATPRVALPRVILLFSKDLSLFQHPAHVPLHLRMDTCLDVPALLSLTTAMMPTCYLGMSVEHAYLLVHGMGLPHNVYLVSYSIYH